MKIYGKEKSKSSLTVIGLALAALALFSGIRQLSSSGSPIMLIFAALILVITFFRTNVEITEEGYDDVMSIAAIKKHNLWKWEEVTFIFADFNKARPDVMLVVRKGSTTKKVTVEPDSIQQIFDWAAEKNDKVRIQYNGEREFNVRNRQTMTEEEYAQAQGEMARPRNFHEMADLARKTKREILLRKPDPEKLKVKRNGKKLGGWK